MRFWMLWQRNMTFSLDTPFEEYPKKIQDVLIHGTDGKEVKVYYKGQRGEGIYDVAFEGSDQECRTKIPRDSSRRPCKAEYEDIHEDYAVQCLRRAERLKQEVAGCNCRRYEYCRS